MTRFLMTRCARKPMVSCHPSLCGHTVIDDVSYCHIHFLRCYSLFYLRSIYRLRTTVLGGAPLHTGRDRSQPCSTPSSSFSSSSSSSSCVAPQALAHGVHIPPLCSLEHLRQRRSSPPQLRGLFSPRRRSKYLCARVVPVSLRERSAAVASVRRRAISQTFF